MRPPRDSPNTCNSLCPPLYTNFDIRPYLSVTVCSLERDLAGNTEENVWKFSSVLPARSLSSEQTTCSIFGSSWLAGKVVLKVYFLFLMNSIGLSAALGQLFFYIFRFLYFNCISIRSINYYHDHSNLVLLNNVDLTTYNMLLLYSHSCIIPFVAKIFCRPRRAHENGFLQAIKCAY